MAAHKTPEEKFVTVLKNIKGVVKVYPYQYEIKVQVENTDIVPEMITKLVEAGGKIRCVTEMTPDLEQVFLSLIEV